MSWPLRPISELCELAVDCVNKTAPVVEHETPYKMIRTTNVKGGFVDIHDVRYVSKDTFDKWTRRSRPRYGDVILTREAPVGEVGRCTFSDEENIFLGQRLFQYRPDPEKLDWNFLAYVLQSPEVQGRLHGRSFGATVPHVKVGDAESLLIPCPPLEEQRQIGCVLSAYDDLIATNQRRIALLEDAARRLYREWFVHLRFPGHESVPVKDGVPEGWAKLPLGDVAEITMGQSPESKYYNTDEDGLPFHQGVSDFGNRFVSHETYTKQATRIAEAGDILCSVRAPVGRLNLTRDKIAIGRGLSAMHSRAGHQSLLFYQLDALFVEEDMIGGGAIFASVGKKELFGQLVLQPSSSIATTFNRLAADIDAQIENLDSQNQELAKARDLLLPKLMSGQLDVSGIRLPDEVTV
ncbi:restriction endonuclease subunit S [Aquaspirillum soli]